MAKIPTIHIIHSWEAIVFAPSLMLTASVEFWTQPLMAFILECCVVSEKKVGQRNK